MTTVAATVDALADLDREGYGSRSLSRGQWDRLLSRSDVVVIVGGGIERPESVAVVRPTSGSECELLRLVVRPVARRRGVGRSLVETLGSARSLEVTLREDSLDALLFARAVGFKAIGLDRGRWDCDGIRMRRERDGE